MTTQTEIHNRIAGEIVKSIVRPPIEAGGKAGDVLVVLESVVLGTLLALSELNDWGEIERETYLRAVVAAVRQRMSKLSGN